MKKTRIKLVKNFDGETISSRNARRLDRNGKWITVDLDFDKLLFAGSMTKQFMLLRPFVPVGYHPGAVEAAEDESEVEVSP